MTTQHYLLAGPQYSIQQADLTPAKSESKQRTKAAATNKVFSTSLHPARDVLISWQKKIELRLIKWGESRLKKAIKNGWE